ncbi:MAG: DEAD/DEAH box helicase [Chloroflexi bacterium]|nr:MAG: DEAD/DEAH box helicase [Chloroflexota bacterium]
MASTAPVLELLSPASRAWFSATLGSPSEVQERGWPAVAAGSHTLMSAPTGSGKTLAAFLWCVDRLMAAPPPPADERCRVLYISPLKALTVDVERNLRAPLRGIALEAERRGAQVSALAVAVRTGDTPAAGRRDIERHPPDILITTPESLFLLLTSAARRVLRSVRWVVVDEIHAVAGSKRGAHLAVSLERLAALTADEPQRIGLSATQRPLDEIARFLGGHGREVEVVDAGLRKSLEITVEVPVEDMADLERGVEPAAAPGQEGPQRSIWPALHPRILELIRAHRSTIVFVNSRRLAERLASRLNELAGEELVLAHHGSIAREQRVVIEERLKAGQLPAIVATSSLELGIDMGAVDLVIQVESPTSVSRGIQRIGRAGHSLGEPSTGVVLPKYRGDLLECAAVVERMLGGDIEAIRTLRNPLDVLAQHIVAMVAMEEWRVDEMVALMRRAHPFRALGDAAFESVLDMLAGRYPSDDFAELRPRVVWDRVAGTVRGRAGAQRLAVTSGGTIPDRGLYTVNLLDDGRRVGELDEEMVYECRPGETFVLGASTWRIAEITASQVLVTPAPGEPGRIAFWHGDALGRPVEIGLSVGRLARELRGTGDAGIARLRERSRFDGRAARNLLAYLDEEVAITGALPDDQSVVVERFRDQLGDWRVCVLSCYGARVHAPWALAVEARLRQRTGLEVQSIHGDEGFALRLPEADRPPDVEELLLDPDEVADLVTEQLSGSALFAARFRENAARALLLPRRRPGSRTPLWLQRQRAHDLLQVASRHPGFPILLETYRECLSDVFDMESLVALMRSLRARATRVVVADLERASPFASSLLFDYIAQYMYEGDAPLAERRAQALTLDRELLAELLGDEELRELLDPAVVSELELELQQLTARRRPTDVDAAGDVLRRLGDLSAEEAQARGIGQQWLEQLGQERRTASVRIAGELRWIAAEDAGRYRDALGVALPPGLPQAYLAAVVDPLDSLLLRWGRTHVPFTAAEPARRWGLTAAAVEARLAGLAAASSLLSGAFHPRGGGAREWCHPEVLRTLRRRSLAALRRQVEAVPVDTLVGFLPQWHGIGSTARGPDRLREVVAQLQGCAVPASLLEREVLAPRVAGYGPHLLDQLVSTGEVVWAGRGSLGAADGRVALYLRRDAAPLLPPPEAREGDLHRRLREHLAARGACFFADLWAAGGGGDEEEVLDALWDMVWGGEVTNDSVAPLRLLGPRPRRSPRGVLLRLGSPRSAGRWWLVGDLLRRTPSPTERLEAQARTLLLRHGVLAREAVAAEAVPGGFAGLYPVLRAMEEAGRIRRGYFIDGLGGSQFALPGAVDRLRATREAPAAVVALGAADPANPFGVSLPWPSSGARLARVPGVHLVLDGGELRLVALRGRRALLTFGEVGEEHLAALAALAGRDDRLEVQSVDGSAAHGSALEPVLRASGFEATPRGLVWYAERRARVPA